MNMDEDKFISNFNNLSNDHIEVVGLSRLIPGSSSPVVMCH